jgi:Domain of unknown function (DUF1083).
VQKILQLGLLAIFPAIAAAQSRDSLDARDTESARTIVVRETAAPMTVDGRLDEAAWASADSIVNLRQRYPQEGAPASELTVVKILRDNSAIYVGARMYDRDPSGIRATQLRRDADLGSDDQFGFIIDSFHDRRGAFVFNTNPNGAMYDAQQTGSENTNVDWNGIWDVAVSRDSAGWTAEFRIPFRTLRFNAGAGSSFGFNARRFVRRRNEEDLWQGWKRTEGIYQFSAEGELTGLGVLTRAHSVELKPYALVRADAPNTHSAARAATAAAPRSSERISRPRSLRRSPPILRSIPTSRRPTPIAKSSTSHAFRSSFRRSVSSSSNRTESSASERRGGSSHSIRAA